MTDEEQFFERVLFKYTGQEKTLEGIRFTSGGCINNAVMLQTRQGPFFIKWNEGHHADMFEKEFRALQLLRKVGALRVPQPLVHGQIGPRYFLLMEYLESRYPQQNYWQNLGQGLALLHGHTAPQFGLDHNNYMGRLPQTNTANKEWVPFFIEQRLEVQLGLALYNEVVNAEFAEQYRALYPKLPDLLPAEQPAMLHGDLWSGNQMPGPEGEPCLFDPALYYGHREAELAMTKLFGGFEPEFYRAYNDTFPLDPGHEERYHIYNIYPLMVHVNLFGTSYLSGVQRVLKRYV